MGSFSGRRLAVRTATAALLAVVAAGGMSVAAGGAYASVSGAPNGKPGPVSGAAPVKSSRPAERPRVRPGRRRTRPRGPRRSAPPAAAAASQLLGNPGFETGTAAPWTATHRRHRQRHARGRALRLLEGLAGRLRHHPHRHAVPAGDHPGRLHRRDVQLLAAHRHRRDHHHDRVRQADRSRPNGTTLATYSNLDAATGYQPEHLLLANYAGRPSA